LDALIEQAVYTRGPIGTEQYGYALLGRSSGVSDFEARELALWAPEDHSLLDGSAGRISINFHKLASGVYCLSTSCIAARNEPDARVYTQFLLVPPSLLARFANNPFALLRALGVSGELRLYDSVPKILEAVRLGGGAPIVDLELVSELAVDPGPAAIATLIQTVSSSDRMAVASTMSAERLYEGLFNVLPVKDRVQYSFSTGLKVSPERPVRMSALPIDQSCWREIAGQGITLLDLTAERVSSVSWKGWAGRVASILDDGDLSVLAAELDAVISADRLRSVAGGRDSAESAETTQGGDSNDASPADDAEALSASTTPRSRGLQRADAPHARFERIIAAVEDYVPKGSVDQLAALLAGQPPAILDLLERVDDLVFTAINGDDRALTELEVLWPTIVDELNEDLVEQSREQYLRCALSIWSECVDGEVHKPERAVAAIDVLCVLFEE